MILAKTISNRQGGPINYFSAEKKNQITTFWVILIEWENIHITHMESMTLFAAVNRPRDRSSNRGQSINRARLAHAVERMTAVRWRRSWVQDSDQTDT